MELSSEDALRLNVMVANAEAIRIDENAMVVYGLADGRELKAPLNPNCRSDRYLTMVREMLSGAVLDSPGGYPVYLRRWTRMGQIDHEQMHRLLKIGEPEAVMAVVCSPGLSDELARRAWWAAPYSEHARRMLSHRAVAEGTMGPVLAAHLVEHLPFETEHRDMLDTVRLVLQPGLIDEQGRRRLWEAGRSRKTYRVGFLEAVPDALPEPLPPRADMEAHAERLAALAREGNRAATLLQKVLASPGQTFLEVAADALRRPADQDVVSALFNAVSSYFADVRQPGEQPRDVDAVTARANTTMAESEEILRLLASVPALEREIRALVMLAYMDEGVLIPIFALTDAVGSVMRKKIEPVAAPMQALFATLRGTG